MKIRTMKCTLEEALAVPRPEHRLPRKRSFLLHTAIRVASSLDLMATHFRYTAEGLNKIKKQPCLILMNHSSFIDLEIVSKIFYPKPYGIICTGDGFVGKNWLMRGIGCIPTRKFVSDVTLIRDMEYLLHKKKSSVLLYPEASYSFDGTATPLPRKMGILLKKLGVPVVSIITRGAFARQPLYNSLQKRKVQVTAHVKCLLTPEDIREKSVAELDSILNDTFSFDNFAWQYENGVHITEPFRADGLERILFKCPHCGAEGQTQGKGIHLTCHACGKKWEMTTLGRMQATEGETEFSHIPDWYAWERQQVRRELEEGTYRLDAPVNIGILVDLDAVRMVGSGRLEHSTEGFKLTGCDGKLQYEQGPLACYSLYSDYYWYEIGDMICIGNQNILYYCFPQDGTPVAKARMAAEELYKMKKARKPREE